MLLDQRDGMAEAGKRDSSDAAGGTGADDGNVSCQWIVVSGKWHDITNDVSTPDN